MVMQNVNAELSKEDENAAVQKIGELEGLFPFLIGLSIDDRMTLPKLGKRNLDFCDRTLIYGKDQEILVTKFLNIEEMERDLVLLKQLQRILSLLTPLHEKLEDTYMQLGAEVYSAARVIYRTSKNANKAGVPGMQSIVKDLGERYRRQFSKDKESGDDSLQSRKNAQIEAQSTESQS